MIYDGKRKGRARQNKIGTRAGRLRKSLVGWRQSSHNFPSKMSNNRSFRPPAAAAAPDPASGTVHAPTSALLTGTVYDPEAGENTSSVTVTIPIVHLPTSLGRTHKKHENDASFIGLGSSKLISRTSIRIRFVSGCFVVDCVGSKAVTICGFGGVEILTIQQGKSARLMNGMTVRSVGYEFVFTHSTSNAPSAAAGTDDAMDVGEEASGEEASDDAHQPKRRRHEAFGEKYVMDDSDDEDESVYAPEDEEEDEEEYLPDADDGGKEKTTPAGSAPAGSKLKTKTKPKKTVRSSDDTPASLSSASATGAGSAKKKRKKNLSSAGLMELLRSGQSARRPGTKHKTISRIGPMEWERRKEKILAGARMVVSTATACFFASF